MDDLEVIERLFEGVRGPSPWYLNSRTRAAKGFSWQHAGNSSPAVGKTLLMGPYGPVAILDFYTYVMVLDESRLLVWNQAYSSLAGLSSPVRLLVIDPTLLMPLRNNLDSLYERMNAEKKYIVLGGDGLANLSLPTTNAADELSIKFPSQVQSIKELLILCHSSGVADKGLDNLALLVAYPAESKYRLYPQDWFNEGSFDYGYQWATRVVRNPLTGHIHGEGVRIKPFVLDDSLRLLREPH